MDILEEIKNWDQLTSEEQYENELTRDISCQEDYYSHSEWEISNTDENNEINTIPNFKFNPKVIIHNEV